MSYYILSVYVYIGGLVNHKKGSSCRMRVVYRLGYDDKSGPSICPSAFCNAYGITSYLRKRLKGEVKNGLFHMESNKLDFHEKKEVVGKDQLKDIKQLLQQSKLKLPKELQVNMELPSSVGILKVHL